MENNNIQTAIIKDVHFKFSIPDGVGPFPVILMLHGWTGDENSMWIFASKMPADALLIAPRGIYNSSMGGYGWYKDVIGKLPALEDFSDAIDQVVSALQSDQFSMGDFSRLRFVGFSQGAALAYALAFRRVNGIKAIAGLSGFVPNGTERIIDAKPLSGLPIFAAHGTKDQIVPVDRARLGLELLKRAGAKITYCEDDVGHKLSASCFRAMKTFIAVNA